MDRIRNTIWRTVQTCCDGYLSIETQGDVDERKAILAEIERQESLLSNVRKQIAENYIGPDDFKVIKADCNKALKLLEHKLENLPSKVIA